nr:glycosyltransferase BC10-like [Ipomoea batatas]
MSATCATHLNAVNSPSSTPIPGGPLGNYPLPEDGNGGKVKGESTVTTFSPPPPIGKPEDGNDGKVNRKSTVITLSPPPTEDEEEDDPMLRVAGRVGSDPGPAAKPKKLAFMFLTTTPLPFAPLWELFFNATPENLYNIYVHADPRYNYTPPFHGVFAGRVIPSKPTRRNTPTLAAAARRLLAHALLHDESNYMFALLSPLCIPLHSFGFTYKTVINSTKSFIEILGREPWAYDRWAARGDYAMLPEVRFEDFRIGSQFYVLTRKHARIVVRDRKLWSKFKQPCLYRDTCYPEEQYFSTLLSMVDPQGCSHATLTHVDWKGSHGGHPRMYSADEVGRGLILTLRNDRPRYGDEEMNGSDPSLTKRHDPFLFARKFSPDSIEPLMRIAKDVILKE